MSLTVIKASDLTDDTILYKTTVNSVDVITSKSISEIKTLLGVSIGANNTVESDGSMAVGDYNTIQDVENRDTDSSYSFVEGYGNIAQEWYGHAEGTGTIADGKISHAEGNQSVCSANDSHAEGNMTVAGRKRYTKSSSGTEDAGDGLGTLPYILVADSEGDVTSYFPNALTDNITTRYGAGAQKDDKGNIYPSGMTPATYSGDTITAVNDLKWAMHPYCIIKGTAEVNRGFFKIMKATYSSGVGTKIYYDNSGEAYSGNILAIYSSYAPTVSVGGIQGGNGQHAEGRYTSTFGYGSHAEGIQSKAWNRSTHAEGEETLASGSASHAEGYLTKSLGTASHSQGYITKAVGDYSFAMGRESVTTQTGQMANAIGKFNVEGDAQHSFLINKIAGAGVGWWDLPIVTMEVGKTYTGTTKLLGRQYSSTNGSIGESLAYRIEWTVKCTGSATADILFNDRSLTGSDFADDSDTVGDHLTTGIRAGIHTTYFANNKLRIRIDGIATRSIYWLAVSDFLELKS